MTQVTLIGLGDMGRALAETFHAAGCDLTVWNRSPDRAAPFKAKGVAVSRTAEEAIRAGPTVIFCVKTHDDTLRLIDAAPDALAGRTIIELSTGEGRAARVLNDRIAELGGTALFGTILAGPGQIGEEGTAFLMAGPADTWSAQEDLIRMLAPASDYIGADVSHLADLFAALFLPRQGAMFGMIYGTHFCEVAGIPLEVYTRQLPAALRVATELYAPTVAATIPKEDYSGWGRR
jgi:3-hydroxyisobutyrate dehydrogenase-like beta-hydroxyacid dehydrogenase